MSLQAPDEPEAAAARTAPFRDHVSHTFDELETKALLAAARQGAATLNDLLLRDALRGLRHWNVRHDGRLWWRDVRLMVPFDLRKPRDAGMPAANVVGMGFIDRSLAWYPGRRWQLWSVRSEMRFLKRFRFAVTFVRAVGLVSRTAWGRRFIRRTQRNFATSTLSNLGRLFAGSSLLGDDGKLQTGGLTLEQMEAAPPIRPGTSVTFGVYSYNDRLTIAMNYDQARFTRTTAADVLGSVVDELRQSIAEADS